MKFLFAPATEKKKEKQKRNVFTSSWFLSNLVTCHCGLAAESITTSSDSAAWIDGPLKSQLFICFSTCIHEKVLHLFDFFTFLCCQGLKYLSAEVFTCPRGRLISSRSLIDCSMSRQILVLSETETDSETTVYYVIGAILYRTLGIMLPAPQWVHLPREPLSNIFIAARHSKAFQSESFRLIFSVSFILPPNISSSPTSFISQQLFISFGFACLNPHSPPFYFSLPLSLRPHNASTAFHSYLPPPTKKSYVYLGCFPHSSVCVTALFPQPYGDFQNVCEP